nr:hypothetical protein [Tanacetum cinerariifolium]
MVAYLSKSDASAGFDQVMDFLNAHVIQYALMVNPTIYVSCIKQFWATTTLKKVNDAIQLHAPIDGNKVVIIEDVIRSDLRLDDADGMECFLNQEIFAKLARMGYEKPPPKLTFYKACSMASAIICLATSKKFNFLKYIFDSMVRNVDSPSKFLMYPRFLQVVINNQVDDLSSHTTRYTFPALTQKVFANIRRVGKGFSGVKTPFFASMLVQPQPQAAEEEDEVKEQPTTTSASFITLLNSMLETCATLSQKVAELKQDKHTHALEIIKLKKRVKKLEKKRRSKSLGLKRLRKVGGKIAEIDDDVDITLVDVETQVDMDAELQGWINQQDINAATKGANVAEPTVFDDEEVTLTMAQTLIKMKAKKAKLFDEQMAKRLHDEEVEKAAAIEKQEKDDLKRVAEETLLQESFKKLKAVEVLGSESTQEILTNDPREMSEEDVQNMLEIVLVTEFKVEALQVKYPIIEWEIHSEGSRTYLKIIKVGGITKAYQSFKDMLKGFDREDLVPLWSLVKEKFSLTVPNVDKEKALLVELKRLFKPDVDDVLWKLQRVMTLMLSAKLQVEEDSEMARDLVMKIFMEANKPKSRSLNTSSK